MRNLKLRVDELIKEKENKIGRPLKQIDISIESGVPQGTLSRYVNNNVNRYDKDVLEKLCDYFDCDLNTLFIWEDES